MQKLIIPEPASALRSAVLLALMPAGYLLADASAVEAY